jgi:hypothetical protein
MVAEGEMGREGADGVRLTPSAYRRNFKLGVINGALVTVANAFVDPTMVLSWFLAQLQVANVLIGAVQPIRMGSSFILQIAASGYLQKQPRKLPAYLVLSFFRCVLLVGMAALVALVPVGSPWLVGGFFAILILHSLSSGLIGQPFLDMVGKTIPASRRGGFFAQRNFWGNILVLGASAAVGALLAEPLGLTFPRNVAVLFLLAGVFFALTALAWRLVDEPPSAVDGASVSVGAQFRRGFRLLKTDPHYRTFVLARLALVPPEWVTPFYIVYAKEALGIAPQMIGVYLAARTVASVLSNLGWSRLSDRHGNRAVVQGAAIVGLGVPLVALLNGTVARHLPARSLLPAYGYGLVFVVMGVFSSGTLIAGISYLLDIVPEAERPLYLGFNSTLFGIARFSALASGLLIDWLGFAPLLIISAGFYLLGIILSLGLVDARVGQVAMAAAEA